MLNGKTAWVSGAASGIGLEIANLYAQEGANVVLTDIDLPQGQVAAQNLAAKARGKICFRQVDSKQAKDVAECVDWIVQEFGALDIACNNAGITGEQASLAKLSLEGWQQLIDINLSGVFYALKYQISAMQRTGGGSIVNIASVLGKVGMNGAGAYVAAKHGVIGLTQVAALENASRGIRVNAVLPGFISTPMIAGVEADAASKKRIESLHPQGRLGLPQEVAELVLWLSSDKASYANGGCYPVDGGYLAR